MSTNDNRVTLTLFDVSEEVTSDDSYASEITSLVKSTLHSPCPARKYLEQKKGSIIEHNSIRKGVLRYLQVKDKWTALGSILIKSQAFHRAHGSEPADRTIVDLPRTQHKKPFIPRKSASADANDIDGDEEVNAFPLSISHQFPFVGSALLESPRKESLVVGLDIVAFDEYNKKLYKSEEDFIDIFKDSFSGREWKAINLSRHRLIEMYCRWAMKEAYTKALGVGMGLEFNSFDLRLESVDDDEFCPGSLWETISIAPEGTNLLCTIYFVDSSKSKQQWAFFFLPLQSSAVGRTRKEGCACVCLGPQSNLNMQVDVLHTTLRALIDWHS